MAWAEAVEWWRGFFPSKKPKLKVAEKPPAEVIQIFHCHCCKQEVEAFKTYADGVRLCFNCASHQR